jgi:6-phosphogluconate dehydrogenase
VFRQWNKGKLNSYLMEISAEVLDHIDPSTQSPLVDVILDRAGQKGTGLWTAVGALEVGSPAQTITAAVFARSLSSLKDERVAASKQLQGPSTPSLSEEEKALAINELEQALYCSKICAYAQGFQLMATASKQHGWSLDFAGIAKIWRAGCIIRAAFLQKITLAFENNTEVLPASLLQGQRDYFGAHTYQRVDKPANESYHTHWSLRARPETKI